MSGLNTRHQLLGHWRILHFSFETRVLTSSELNLLSLRRLWNQELRSFKILLRPSSHSSFFVGYYVKVQVSGLNVLKLSSHFLSILISAQYILSLLPKPRCHFLSVLVEIFHQSDVLNWLIIPITIFVLFENGILYNTSLLKLVMLWLPQNL